MNTNVNQVHRNMGVHLSFVRSTVLDTWTWDQLRLMRVGGNAAAAEYFKKHGGSSLLSTKDAKIKYSSRPATQYKEEIKKRAALDAKMHPDFDFDEDTPDLNDEQEGDDDFFSSWDKPTIVRPTPPPSRTSTPPIIGRSASPLLANGDPRPAQKTINSSSNLRKVTNISSSARRTGGIVGAKKTTSKLSAKKATAEIDFDEAERLAKAEEERIAQLGYDAAEEERLQEERVKKAAADRSSQRESATAMAAEQRRDAPAETTQAFARLGFGQTANTAKPQATKKPGFGAMSQTADDSPTTARDKYAAQKSISSDQYFGRGAHDASAQAEAKERLGAFGGAQSISSNQYFGRAEEEDAGGDSGDLEATARQYIGQIKDIDVDRAKELLGAGAMKLGRYVDDFARNF